MKIPVSAEDLQRIIDRRTVRRFERSSPEWAERTAHQRRRYARRRRKQKLLAGLGLRARGRTQSFVKDYYESHWNSALEQVTRESVDLFEWHDTGYEAHKHASPALHNHLVACSLEALEPETVLEVGSGNGLHLICHSGRFPKVRFHGLELTATGVKEARAMADLETLPPELVSFCERPVLDDRAHQRIDFRQGSAAELPFETDAVDIVYTTIALEQMEEIRQQALDEVARVAKRYAVLVEPFRDFNTEGSRRDYVLSRDIFGAHVEDLPAHGLEPVEVFTDFPVKVSLGVGMVVARVR